MNARKIALRSFLISCLVTLCALMGQRSAMGSGFTGGGTPFTGGALTSGVSWSTGGTYSQSAAEITGPTDQNLYMIGGATGSTVRDVWIAGGQPSSGSDAASGLVTIASPAQRGVANSAVRIETAASADKTTGSNSGNLTERVYVTGKRKNLPDNVNTTFVSVSVPSNTASASVYYSIEVINDTATSYQNQSGWIDAVAVNNGGTLTITSSHHDNIQAVTAGTLTVTMTVVDTGTSAMVFRCQSDTSLSVATVGYQLITYMVFINGHYINAVTPG